MQFTSNFLPILQPADWPGRSSCVHRMLIDDEPDCPLIACFAEVSDISNMSLTIEAMESAQLTVSEIEDQARSHWLAHFQDVVWGDTPKFPGFVAHMETASGEAGGADTPENSEFKLLTAMPMGPCGDAFSSGILLQGILKGMHRSLACERLYVAVPDRFTILASNSVDLAHYSASAYKEAAESNAEPLCPHVFIAEQGTIMGIVEVEGSAMISSSGSGLKHIPDECVVALAAVGVCMGQVNGKISRKANEMMLDIIAEKASEEPGSLAQGVALVFLQDVERFRNLGAAESGPMLISKLSLAWLKCKSLNNPQDEESYREFLLDVAYGMSGLEGGIFHRKGKPTKHETQFIHLLVNVFYQPVSANPVSAPN